MSYGGDAVWADVPKDAKNLRACMVCKLIKTQRQFVDNGCENCPFLEYKGDSAKVEQCSSQNFFGTVSLMNPKGSFVARFNNLSNNVPGLYATKVVGELPESVLDYLNGGRA